METCLKQLQLRSKVYLIQFSPQKFLTKAALTQNVKEAKNICGLELEYRQTVAHEMSFN